MKEIFLLQAVQDQIQRKQFGSRDLGARETVDSRMTGFFKDIAISGIEAGLGLPPLRLLLGNHDRPVGLIASGNESALPNTAVVLTREIIEVALTGSFAPVVEPSQGIMIAISKHGILVITFLDRAAPGGNIVSSFNDERAIYSMAPQVERIP